MGQDNHWQFLSLQPKHGAVERGGTKKLTFFKFPFQEKSIVENININEMKMKKLIFKASRNDFFFISF